MEDLNTIIWRLSRQLMNILELMGEDDGNHFQDPLIELGHEGKDTILTIELPAVRPEDLKVNVGKGKVGLDVLVSGVNAYSGSFKIPQSKPETARITYLNGILQVRVERV